VTIVAGRENPGFNPYVTQELISGTSGLREDPHEALRNNHTPAMLLFPECNYLSWNGAIAYRSTLPDLKIYYVPRAGHYIQFEQPQLLTRAILAFVLDQRDVIPPYTADADPRSRIASGK
jgi:pimeloyl-ACP methyl ester carboxylesterase